MDWQTTSGLTSWEGRFLGANLSGYVLSKTFPFHLILGQDLQILQSGDAIQQLFPGITVGSSLQQHFYIRYPNGPINYGELSQQSSTSMVLEASDNSLQLQGQLLFSENRDILFFLGIPHIPHLEALKILGANLSNWKVQDSVADFLFLLQARTVSLSDARRLAEKLTEQRAELHRALAQSELTTAVLEQATDAIEIMDPELKILYVNSAFEKITGYSRSEAIGKTPATLFRAGQPEEGIYAEISRSLSSGQVWHGSYIGRRKDGSFYHQEATLFPVLNYENEVTNYVAIKRDISDRKQTQTKLEHSLSILNATFEATADSILVTDIRGKILHFNQKFVDLWQIPASILNLRDNRQSVLHHIAGQLRDPQSFSSKKMLELYVRPHTESYDILELKDGRVLELYSSPQRLDDVVIGWVWSFRDVTERQRTEARMRYQALYDTLTGLPNRVLFHDRLSDALAQAGGREIQVAVLFLDLDRFKLINDTLGHAAGDLLLQEFAQRLRSCLRDSDVLARWAGDEFTLLIPRINGAEEAAAIAQRIMETLKPEFNLDGHLLRVTSSIGIAIYPQDGTDAETLLKHADAALYQTKEAGRNGYHFYTSTTNSAASAWLTLENHLNRALERQEFVLHYQPQVNLVTGEIIQMEALLRWQSPELGLVSPDQFIPLAEESGLILAIGEWVLRTACRQQRLWQESSLPSVGIGINLSGHQFKQPRLVESIHQILQETGMEPRYLELEITETTVMKDVDRTHLTLEELHQLGISIALDDFGTGYSSLNYLKKFPFHTLKIDQSFIAEVTTDTNDEAIVTAIIALGRVLKLKLVAEGVETREQAQLLQSLGCETMQGYLFSHPVPADRATELLQHRSSPELLPPISGSTDLG
ncbi:hypothetical protein BST81_05930 [Leptolyngbya sp. 'hensonii']|uniref:EAL domain-containing protein n=1 Tax=Leptolyngbya sp. 'hensonii' TaxID=1922337 RepID=UPI000950005A|nr:EAL domain-containing protein [Leptolyngbya sp. 'hensonii']OLP19295.1 hypothetical protein BST81_05930 [Leptolyngbya sp. 'hensonii']